MLFQLYSNHAVMQIVGWVLVFCGLIAMNEIGRRTKKGGIAVFVVIPTVLTVYFILAHLGMFGGNTQSSSGSLLGSLLGMGGNHNSNAASLGASLLGGLLGGGNQQQNSPLGGGLLGSLLGGGSQNSAPGLGSMLGSLFGRAPQQSNAGSFSGMDLLNLLNALK